jgi:hypothetical protein
VRALKILVIVMGIMLVGGFVALIISIAYMVKYRPTAAPAVTVPYTAPAIELPAGARIETLALDANRLVLSIIMPGGERELMVLDPTSGRRLGTIPVRSTP